MADVKSFLDKIAELESSSGKDTQHKTVESGIQAGDTAIGRYGLMPKTIDEMVNRATKSKTITPEMKSLIGMSGEEKKEYLETHPEVEYKVAEQLATQVLGKQGGDEEKAAYSWLYGHNLSPEKIEARNYEDDPYVKKLKDLRETASMDENKPIIKSGSEDEGKLKNYIEGLGQPDDKSNARKKLLQDLSSNPEGYDMFANKFSDTGREGNFGEKIDSFLGVPVRTAMSEMQKGNFDLDMLKKTANSFGSDPKTAPSGADLTEAMGVENPYLGAGISTALDLGAQIPVGGLMAKAGVLPGVVGRLAKFEGAADDIAKLTPQMEKFMKMKQALGREGGYAQRVGQGKSAQVLSNEAGNALSGLTQGTMQDAAIQQQLANKLKGL